MTKAEAEEIARRWIKDGRISFTGKGEFGQRYFAVRADCAPPPEERGRTAEENMWLSMRKLRSYTITDIMAHATSEDAPVTKEKAREYIRALLAAKFIRPLRKASPEREALYVTVKKKGVKAPLLRRVRVIEDPNTGKMTLLTGGDL